MISPVATRTTIQTSADSISRTRLHTRVSVSRGTSTSAQLKPNPRNPSVAACASPFSGTAVSAADPVGRCSWIANGASAASTRATSAVIATGATSRVSRPRLRLVVAILALLAAPPYAGLILPQIGPVWQPVPAVVALRRGARPAVYVRPE